MPVLQRNKVKAGTEVEPVLETSSPELGGSWSRLVPWGVHQNFQAREPSPSFRLKGLRGPCPGALLFYPERWELPDDRLPTSIIAFMLPPSKFQ